MVSLDEIRDPITTELLIGFADIRGFTRLAKRLGNSADTFAFFDRLTRVMTAQLSSSTGRILKFIGDATLIVFPGTDADAGVTKLLDLKKTVDSHIEKEGFDSRIVVCAHYGEATIGLLGEVPDQRLDVYGESVNRAALLERANPRAEFVISPEAFRKLKATTRKLFHKYTAPIVYTAA